MALVEEVTVRMVKAQTDSKLGVLLSTIKGRPPTVTSLNPDGLGRAAGLMVGDEVSSAECNHD